MRTPLVIGNWKMHGTLAEARALAGAIREMIRRPRGVQVVVCPPFTALAAVAEVLAGGPIQLGAQTCHHEPAGAHTGEISATEDRRGAGRRREPERAGVCCYRETGGARRRGVEGVTGCTPP